MQQKRRNSAVEKTPSKPEKESASVQRKKQRKAEARHISVQFIEHGEQQIKSVNNSSMEGLPSTIDVEKFAEARAFEIQAMQDAMKNAASASTHRVWQTLPRHLRRRAASHDVRRVPARLRQRALSEMDAPSKLNKKKKSAFVCKGRKSHLTRTENLLKRQEKNTWLETHIWHSKRMHMENMWGFRLAATPTEKSFRPSHRASVHGCILHDASYEAIIELKGPEQVLKDTTTFCSDPQCPSPGVTRFIKGSRMCSTNFYQPKSYPFGLIGPVEIIWRPDNADSDSKNRGNKQNDPDSLLWIKCHPLIYDEVLNSIKYSVQLHLQKAQSTSDKELKVEVADLRNQFNIFELMGPKASQVIHGAFNLTNNKVPEVKKFWEALGQLQTAESVPRGMIIGCKVHDPRLSFPPKNTKIHYNHDGQSNQGVKSPDGLWPSSKLAFSELWDEETRMNLSNPHFKKADIDKRKSENLVPGTKLRPLRQDNRIPILLIQRSIESNSTNTQSNGTRSLHGWTLLIPKGWGMPFFSSLTHTGSRIGGLRERNTQYFEAASQAFPVDYPCTQAYETCADERAQKEKEKWERTPPAKRPSWEKLGTQSPYKPDWDVILGLKTGDSQQEVLVSTQREAEEMDIHRDEPNQVHPWILRGPEAIPTIEQIYHIPNPASELLLRVNTWRNKLLIPKLGIPAESLFQTALVSVRLSFPLSASPENDAVIYSMEDEEVRQWQLLLEGSSETQSESELSNIRSPQDAIIGYATSSNYSLSIGKGRAMATISLKGYLKIKEQSYRQYRASKPPLIKIRNKDSSIYRAAFVELIS